jgi:hypothetical protein
MQSISDRRKFYSTDLTRGESISIEICGTTHKIEMKFAGMVSSNMARICFELPPEVFIKKEERQPTRKVRTL